jgi:hypothetical protein
VSYFDLLVVANAIAAIIALYQLRICTLILVGNNLLVSRALGSIERYGPPTSQRFIPASVFSSDNLSTAAGILTISLVTVVAFTLASARQRIRIGPDAPAVPRFALVLIGLFFLVYMGKSETILSSGYTTAISTPRYDFELAGGTALICGLLVYELARRRLLALITARRAFMIVFVTFFFVFYLKGSTGIVTGYLVTSAMLYLPRTGAAKRMTNMFRIGGVLLGILVMSFIVRMVREGLSEGGLTSITGAVESAIASEESRDEGTDGLESTANASQSATHMLLCETLYDSGISRDWRSIYDVVEYTFIPSFFERWFGWERSIDSRWELASYYTHGGGINVLGEFYWNGGWLCVVIMTTLLSFFAYLVDKNYRASTFWLLMMAQFAPSFLMGYGYGFAQVSRGAINALLVAGVYWGMSRLRMRGQATLQPQTAGQAPQIDSHFTASRLT